MNIALVEDEKKLAISLQSGLQDEGYSVKLFHDGTLAEQQLLKETFDLIILDLLLPGKDGFSICQALRNQGIMTPVIILTALDQTTDKVQALDSGADDLLNKPFSFEELLARLRALLRRSQKRTENTLTLGDITLNANTHEVHRKNKRIPLTLREFELLETLLQHPGQVMKRQDLFQQHWGNTDETPSNVVDVHIFHLRKKLDGPFSKKYIRTVRSIGYIIQK